MSAINLNWNPTDRQLRQFGLVSLLALPLIAFLLTGRPDVSSWQPQHTYTIGVASAAGILLAGLGWFRPGAIRHVFIIACLIAFPIGMVIGELLLLLVFVLVFTPMAIVFRLVRRDPLERRIRRDAPSYWKPKKSAVNVRSYFRQS